MDIPSMREIRSPQEIQDLIFNFVGLGQQITLWQNLKSDRRNIQARLVRIHREYKTLEFEPKQGSFSFASQRPLYFFSPKKWTILKGRIVFNSHFKLSVQMPELIMAKEYRENLRHNFSDGKNKRTISFTLQGANQVGRSFFTAALIDLSSKGMALRLSPHDFHKICEGDRVEFERLFNEEKALNLVGRVHYLTRVRRSEGASFYRLGIVFDQEFDIVWE